MNKFWEFKNQQNDDEVELRISGEIVSDDSAWIYEWFGISAASPNAFRDELNQYKGKNIRVWIDSYGGDVFAGAGIYNALKEHDGKVITVVDGKAMSAASVIAMAGEEIHMSPVGMMMIHNPWTGTYGEAKDMRHAADVLDEVKETIINAYHLKTGKSRNKISEMMDNETFMSAKTAVKEGFADKVLYSESNMEPIENNFMFSRLAIQNSMVDSMKKFFEVAKNNQVQGATQVTAPQSPVANKNKTQEVENAMEIKNVAELEAAYPHIVKEVRDTAKSEGVTEERTRLQTIDDISNAIAPELVNKAKYEEPITAEQLAIAALKSDGQRAENFLNNLTDDAKDSKVNNVDGSSAEEAEQAKNQAQAEQTVNMIAEGGNKRRNK